MEQLLVASFYDDRAPSDAWAISVGLGS
jgi:hypothetical protein